MTVTAEPAPAPAPVQPAGARTVPARLLEQADRRPGVVALREKRLGRWMEITWGEYADRAAKAGLGLRELGVRPGDRVAILSDNRPEWLYVDLAVQGIGAVTVGLYPTGAEDDVAHVLRDSGAHVIIVENEEQLDKTVAVRAQLPDLQKIVIVDTRGIKSLDDPMVISLDQLENLGAIPAEGERAKWREHVDAVRGGDDVAVVVYSSGIAGPPQG
ncbi:MAG TPA: AMP-binding protein, partial [Acidimicrobiia bacterium]|nr:AMP-binding protein [Acidimicrobiia bacterium]